MRIFKDMLEAMYKLDSYNRFIRYKKSKNTSYLFLMPLFRILVIILVSLIAFFSRYGSIASYMKEVIPDFTLDASGLEIKEKVDEVYGNLYVYIDTDKTFDESEVHEKAATNIFIYNDVILSTDNFGNVNSIDFKDYDFSDAKGLTRDEFADDIASDSSMILALIIVIAVGAVLFYIGTTFAYAFTSMLLLFAVKIVAKSKGKKLTDRQAFTISIYAKTATFLLTTMLSIMNIVLDIYLKFTIAIPYFYAIKLIICLIYVYYIVAKIEETKPEFVSFGFEKAEDIYENESDVSREENKEETKPVQPDIIIPSDSWSFGEKKEDSNE